MPMVIDPICEIECEAIVQAIDVSPDGKWMAWGGEDGTIRILDMSDSPTQLDPFNVEDSVTHIQFARGEVIIVGTHTSDVYGHELLGGRRWTHAVGGGCDLLDMSEDGTLIACIDGGRHVHVFTENGVKRGRFSSGELI